MKKAALAAITILMLLSVGCDLARQPDIPAVARSTIRVGEAKRGDFLLRSGGEGVLTSDQTAELEVQPERQASDVQIGQPAVVRIGRIEVAGKVIQIDPPRLSGRAQVVPVIVALAGVPKDAQRGSPVTGRIDAMTLRDAIYIPTPDLAPAQTLLYRLNPDQPTGTPVRVEYGRIGIDLAEIRSGLNPGDRVIVSITAQYEAFGRISLR